MFGNSCATTVVAATPSTNADLIVLDVLDALWLENNIGTVNLQDIPSTKICTFVHLTA